MELYNTQNYIQKSYDIIRKAYEKFIKQSLEKLTSHLGDYSGASYLSKRPSTKLINPVKYQLEQ